MRKDKGKLGIRKILALACGTLGFAIKPSDFTPVETPSVEVVACGGRNGGRDEFAEAATLKERLDKLFDSYRKMETEREMSSMKCNYTQGSYVSAKGTGAKF